MYQAVPNLETDVTIEVGEFSVTNTRIKPREDVQYIPKNKRLYVNKTKDDERKSSLGFFLHRLSFLNYKETNYMFKQLDNIQDIQLTKKNNVITAPYILLVNLSSNGFRFTETFLELYFLEIYKENSKKFKFNTQIQLIRDKLGYEPASYFTYDFEEYFCLFCLILKNKKDIYEDDPKLFDIICMAPILKSLSEITYKLYVSYIKSKVIQWSISTSTLIAQLVNTVLIVLYNLMTKSMTEQIDFQCKLAYYHPVPVKLLSSYYTEFTEIMTSLLKLKSFRINLHIQNILLGFCSISNKVE